MAEKKQHKRGKSEASRSVFLSFEFERDAGKRKDFLHQAGLHSDFALRDKSLPAAEHDDKWRKEVKERMKDSDLVIVLLGPDTQNAPGVLDELSLAGEVERPVIQLMPQRQNYGLAGKYRAFCKYKWILVNQMLRDPAAFAKSPANRGK